MFLSSAIFFFMKIVIKVLGYKRGYLNSVNLLTYRFPKRVYQKDIGLLMTPDGRTYKFKFRIAALFITFIQM